MKTCGGSITRPKMAYNGYHRRLDKMPSRSSYVLVAEFDPLSASCLCAQPELASVVPERSETTFGTNVTVLLLTWRPGRPPPLNYFPCSDWITIQTRCLGS